MSFEVTTSFVQMYGSTVEHVLQQHGSVLRNAVSIWPNFKGKSDFFEQMGSNVAQRRTTRHGDSPLNPTPHLRRRITVFDWEMGDLVDDVDKIRLLIDPASEYVQSQAMAHGRAMDGEILDAMFGTAYTGEDGTTAVTSGWHTVAVNSWAYGTGSGNAGMTISKLIEGRTKLLGAEALMPGDQLHIACTAAHIGQLLQTTEVTSSDYNTVKALVNGEINSFLGINFHRTELIRVNGSSQYRCPMWVTSGIKLAVASDIKSRIAERPDKSFSTYAYTSMTIGATRTQELKVAEIITT